MTERDGIVAEIQALETRAHQFGLHVTGRALNQAKNACGWEVAGDTLMAGKAALGERPKSKRRI